MNDGNRRRNIATEVEASRSCVREAQVLLQHDLFAGAISRAYYALFHLVQAVLLTEGLEAHSHAGTGHLLNLHFVRTGKLPIEVQRTFSRLQKLRQDADYATLVVADRATAEDDLNDVAKTSAVLEQFLRDGGWLS